MGAMQSNESMLEKVESKSKKFDTGFSVASMELNWNVE